MDPSSLNAHLMGSKTPFSAVADETKNLIFSAVPLNTVRVYKNALKRFVAWLDGQSPDDRMLADYVAYLYEKEDKSPATIALAVAAVNWLGKYMGVGRISGVVTAEALSAVKRREAQRIEAGEVKRRGQVKGLTWDDVDRVCEYITSHPTVKAFRDSALIQLMSDCLLRVSEAVAVNVSNLREKTLYIARSKTDQMGEGKHLYMTRATRNAVRRYMDTAGITDGALFRRILKGGKVTEDRLTASSARYIIKGWAEKMRLEGISGHSMRIGSAVSLMQAGASLVDLQTEGRWKDSRMPAHYADAVSAEQGAIARFKEGRLGGVQQ